MSRFLHRAVSLAQKRVRLTTCSASYKTRSSSGGEAGRQVERSLPVQRAGAERPLCRWVGVAVGVDGVQSSLIRACLMFETTPCVVGRRVRRR